MQFDEIYLCNTTFITHKLQNNTYEGIFFILTICVNVYDYLCVELSEGHISNHVNYITKCFIWKQSTSYLDTYD